MDFAYKLLRDPTRALPHFTYSPIWMLGCKYEPSELPPSPSASPFLSRIRLTGSSDGEGEGDREGEILVEYPQKVFASFLCDYCSRPWFSYRKDMQAIGGSYFTSDAGWGCMLRTGQMFLAHAFIVHFLSRDWRISTVHSPVYDEIMRWFGDYPNSLCPYSIHRIAERGLKYGKSVGEWFGPCTIALVLDELMAQHKPRGLQMYVSTDGALYLDQIRALCSTSPVSTKEKESDKSEEWQSLLIVIPVRLGLDQLNPEYYTALKAFFTFPQSLGIAGGRPRSSLYFVAVQDDSVFYLNPHTIQPLAPLRKYRADVAASLVDSSNEPSEEGEETNDVIGEGEGEGDSESEREKESEGSFASTYHCPVPQKVHISEIDPSMALIFYCRDKPSLDDFCRRTNALWKEGHLAMYQIEETTPEYMKKKTPPVYPPEKLFSDDEDDDDVVFL